MDTVTTTETVAGRRPTSREALLQRLINNFQDANSFGTLQALVEGTSGVSLRLLDFFLCHYSLMHAVQYPLPDQPLPFCVHEEYAQTLDNVSTTEVFCQLVSASTTDTCLLCKRKFGKVLFDCFSRKQRCLLRRGDTAITTSAGQVTFLHVHIDGDGFLDCTRYVRRRFAAEARVVDLEFDDRDVLGRVVRAGR